MKSWNAVDYDQNYLYVSKAAASLVALLAPQPTERILDLGCGTGQLTKDIASTGAQTLGIDASTSMVDAARAQFPALNFQVADACTYRTTELFDAVFSNAVLHWILKPESVAETICTALKPGGRFVAEFGGYGNVSSIHRAIRDQGLALGIKVPEFWYFPTVSEYCTVLERQGLEVRFATLFDRPTPLQKGVRGWVEMFASPFLDHVPSASRETFLQGVEDRTRATQFHNGQWIADYRRLRVLAIKPKENDL